MVCVCTSVCVRQSLSPTCLYVLFLCVCTKGGVKQHVCSTRLPTTLPSGWLIMQSLLPAPFLQVSRALVLTVRLMTRSVLSTIVSTLTSF